MTDYMDILSICAYDIEKSSEIVEEVLADIGLEKLESKSDRQTCGGLCCSCCCESSGR